MQASNDNHIVAMFRGQKFCDLYLAHMKGKGITVDFAMHKAKREADRVTEQKFGDGK